MNQSEQEQHRERKTKQDLRVVSQKEIAEGIYDLWLAYPEGGAPRRVRPGQFAGLYTSDPARLLPRPISICEYSEGMIRFVYRRVGAGTGELSALRAGDTVPVLGILGNGYDLSLLTGRRVLLLGGGIGAPPLLGLAKAIHAANHSVDRQGGTGSVVSVLGYRTNDLFLADEFAGYGNVIIATDDGSAGVHGNVIDAVKENAVPFDVICACGPMPMLRGVKTLAEEKGVPCYLSLEERMACGVGACLGCVTRTVKADGHSHVKNARVCTEGPVFRAEDVEL